MRWVDITYKCRCMDKEAVFQVRERLDDEELLDYMGHVQAAIGVDHGNRSPRCKSKAMEYAKIPVNGDRIGGATGGMA